MKALPSDVGWADQPFPRFRSWNRRPLRQHHLWTCHPTPHAGLLRDLYVIHAPRRGFFDVSMRAHVAMAAYAMSMLRCGMYQRFHPDGVREKLAQVQSAEPACGRDVIAPTAATLLLTHQSVPMRPGISKSPPLCAPLTFTLIMYGALYTSSAANTVQGHTVRSRKQIKSVAASMHTRTTRKRR